MYPLHFSGQDLVAAAPADSVVGMTKDPVVEDPPRPIKALREALGLTQQAAADATPEEYRLRRDQWNRLETGVFKMSRTEHLRAVAHVFGITTDELVAYCEGRATLEQVLAQRTRRAAAPPRLASHPRWPKILKAAKRIAPGIAPEVWEGLANLEWPWAPPSFERLDEHAVAQIAMQADRLR